MTLFQPGTEVFVTVPVRPNVSAWPTYALVAGDRAPARVLLGRRS